VPLDVALAVRSEAALGPGAFAVEVKVTGATAPLRLLLYCDGTLASACDSVADRYEFRASMAPGARHALTARVVDAAGRSGGASTMFGIGAAEAPEPRPAPEPRIVLRSSVRTRPVATGPGDGALLRRD
jgi:hypothetical protein